MRTGQFTTVAFPAEIADLSLGSSSYAVHIKVLKAKSKQVSSTSLFLRYGPEKEGYTAEVFFDEQAPLLVAVDKPQRSVEVAQGALYSLARCRTNTI